MFSPQKNWRRGQKRFCLEARWLGAEREGDRGQGAKMVQTMYTYMNKCINN
jgi:hypothetical protein